MRKILFPILLFVMTVVLAACGGNKVDDTTKEKYVGLAEEVITLLNEGKYEEIYANFDDEMQRVLPVNEMEKLTPIIEESGDFQEIDKATVEEKDGNYITVLVAKYSKTNRVFTITFNGADEVAGLFIK